MSFDDERTRRIPATPPPAVPRDPYPAAATDELLRRIASLRTAVALLGLLAAVALALALYAVLAEDDGQAGRGASQERVSAIDSRVDELEGRLEDRATEGDLEELRSDQEQLAEQVEEATSDDGAGEAVQQLQEDLQALQQRVDELAQAPADDSGGAAPTP